MKAVLAIVGAVVVLAILRPWTIRPIGDTKPAVFDAAGFAASAWPKLLEEANQTAVDLTTGSTAAGTPPQARFVKGIGKVIAIDRDSRVGVLRVQVANAGPTVAIQIGPVIRGTALRDATSFIRFSDFTNQFDYAGAANALNESALRLAIAPVESETLKEKVVSFVGAVGRSPVREDGAIEIVPVRLGVSGGSQ